MHNDMKLPAKLIRDFYPVRDVNCTETVSGTQNWYCIVLRIRYPVSEQSERTELCRTRMNRARATRQIQHPCARRISDAPPVSGLSRSVKTSAADVKHICAIYLT